MAAQPSSRHALALPATLSPDDLDTLSELSTVLAKVRAGIQSASGLTGTGTTPGAANHQNSNNNNNAGSGGASGAAASSSNTGGAGSGSSGGGSNGAQQLSFKDVPGATDGIKHKLQHARAQIRALPDMDRSVDDQRREIEELEARIERQRGLLERLRERGVRFGKGDEGAGGDDVKMDM
ncbi:hypothetical protein JDV02_003854 [Purpureocillium takamizusanense]|uniref:Mediator of RNA polymerase II transcription subunit 9 n=1 Tax=Purpureocillium takamizusanense TaxID=2060973 RepID=A0A9Q8QE00_9HYPO|nr:uncharacterized protein JDV02_003854 [Purpureocillium takamizusanense]UNI17517.1 hypothetical protein JDV02_003854 [Purpureocillium takamizusanense]